MKSYVSMAIATLPMLLTGCPTAQQAPGGPYGSAGYGTGDDQPGDDQTGADDSGGGCVGEGCAPQPCMESPQPWLPFPAGTSMGVTQKPGCYGHTGSLAYAYDFNILYGYETDNDLVTVASSDGTVVEVVDHVVGSCADAQCDSGSFNYGWGNCVVIELDHACGDVYERYCHLDVGPGAIFVEEGQHVCHGTPLGRIGNTGKSTNSHLHWQREDGSGQSVLVDRFVELDIPDGCTECEIPTEHSPGCFDSQNVPPTECVAPPADPCDGLPSGDYCGSNPQLMGYGGASSDLVTCQDGSISDIVPCPAGCQENPPGVDDECFDSGGEPYCGNGIVEPGEACDGADLGGSSCTSEGYDGGTLGCGGGCQLDASQCCSDQCSPGDSTCSGSSMTLCELVGECYDWGDPINCPYGCSGDVCNNVSCGDGNVNGGEQCDGADLDGQDCQDQGFDGGTLQCGAGCTFNTTWCCEQEHTILNAVYPTYTASGAACTVGGGVGLKISAQQISDSTVRFHVRKTDDTAWASAATLTLYVGTGPTCGNPPNVIKETAPVVVGQVTQTIDLMVDPYDAAWAMDEVKEFWVGKSESGYPAARASGVIEIVRECL